MPKKLFFKNKRGSELVLEEVVFILISLLFFASLIYFVEKNANSSVFLEEINAKKIGILIDSSKSGTDYILDVSEILAVSKENKKSEDWVKINSISIDQEKNVVIVKTDDRGGFSFPFFSENNIDYLLNIQGEKAELLLSIK